MIKKYPSLLILLLALLGSYLGQLSPMMRQLDNLQYDFYHRLADTKRAAAHSVLIALDPTQQQETALPLLFRGAKYAELIAKLRELDAAAIGLDFLPTLSAASGLEALKLDDANACPQPACDPVSKAAARFDKPFQEELLKGGIVMPSLLVTDNQGQTKTQVPHADYLFPLLVSDEEGLGPSNLHADPDGLIRTFVINFHAMEEKPQYAFAPLIAKKAGAVFSASDPIRPIGYIGPQGVIPRITPEQLLSAEPSGPLHAAIRGKVAIIAADHPGNQDLHKTPYGEMNGAEIQAQIIETLLSGQYPKPASLWMNLALSFGFLIIGLTLFLRLSPWHGLLLLPLFLLLISGFAYAAFLQETRFTPTLPQLGISLAFLATIALRFSREERKRQHTYRLLTRYVSEPVARRIAKGNQLPHLGGESVEATILTVTSPSRPAP